MEIPLFPLHTVAFPTHPTPLVIFEDRYKAMLERVLATDRRFAIAAIRSGMEAGGFAETYPVGCIVEVRGAAPRGDGTFAVDTVGVSRLRIESRPPDDPYPLATGVELPDEPGEDAAAALDAARASLQRYAAALGRATRRAVAPPSLPDDAVEASYHAAAALVIEVRRRQLLLECDTAARRLEAVAFIADSEAALVATVGPPAGRTGVPFSAN